MSIIYQKPRKLYTVRNMNGRATRKAVMAAPSLELNFLFAGDEDHEPELLRMLASFQVMSPSPLGFVTSEQSQALKRALPAILTGKDTHWKLWEAEIHTDRIVLNFVDLTQPATTRVKNTDISCFMFWQYGVELMVFTPPELQLVPEYYHIWFTTSQKGESYLNIVYPSGLTTANSLPLVHDETYGIRPQH